MTGTAESVSLVNAAGLRRVGLASIIVLRTLAFAWTTGDEAGLRHSGLGNVYPTAPETHLSPGSIPVWNIACQRAPQLLVDVFGLHEPVDVRADFSLSQLEDLARQGGRRGKHRPLGFYSRAFAYGIRVDMPDEARGACIGPIRISINMSLTKRQIEIGQELAGDPCQFSLVLAHYVRHAETDDKVFSRFVQWVIVTLKSSSTPPLLGGTQSIEEDRGRLAELAKQVVEQGLPLFHTEGDSGWDSVDTPAELQKLAEGCSTHA